MDVLSMEIPRPTIRAVSYWAPRGPAGNAALIVAMNLSWTPVGSALPGQVPTMLPTPLTIWRGEKCAVRPMNRSVSLESRGLVWRAAGVLKALSSECGKATRSQNFVRSPSITIYLFADMWLSQSSPR